MLVGLVNLANKVIRGGYLFDETKKNEIRERVTIIETFFRFDDSDDIGEVQTVINGKVETAEGTKDFSYDDRYLCISRIEIDINDLSIEHSWLT